MGELLLCRGILVKEPLEFGFNGLHLCLQMPNGGLQRGIGQGRLRDFALKGVEQVAVGCELFAQLLPRPQEHGDLFHPFGFGMPQDQFVAIAKGILAQLSGIQIIVFT